MSGVCFGRVSLCRLAAAASVCALSGAPAALAFTVPEPGLWETRTQSTLNGVDLMAEMRKSVEAQLQQMNPQQRARMGPMLQEMRDNLSGVDKECITPEEAKRYRSPQAVIDEMNKDEADANCRFSLVEVSGDVLRFRGDCKASPEAGGFDGTVRGEMKTSGARAWSGFYRGTGRMVVPEGVTLQPEVMRKLAGPVQFEMKSSGRWLDSQCGAVEP